MFSIDYKSQIPIYDQIVKSVIRLRALGALKAGEQLPSVRQTAIKLGVNPNTVQKAYNILENKGVIVSVSGKGSFVSDEFDAKEELKNEAAEELKSAIIKAKNSGFTEKQITDLIYSIYGGDAK